MLIIGVVLASGIFLLGIRPAEHRSSSLASFQPHPSIGPGILKVSLG
jgi:hypothetical protein